MTTAHPSYSSRMGTFQVSFDFRDLSQRQKAALLYDLMKHLGVDEAIDLIAQQKIHEVYTLWWEGNGIAKD